MKTKEKKREEAQARQALSDKRTPAQRLAGLDKVFGPGQGAALERARLAGISKTAAKPGIAQRRGLKAAFAATPAELGRAAVAQAKKGHKPGQRQYQGLAHE